MISDNGRAMGASGWIIPVANMQTEKDILYSGGGRGIMEATEVKYGHKQPEQMPDGQRMSSTRMEVAAILSLHLALRRLDPERALTVRNGIDSKSAMQTHDKLVHMQLHEVYNMHSHDIWLLIKQLQEDRAIEMFHVRAHTDKHLKDVAKAQGEHCSDSEIYSTLAPDWRGNYHADDQADDMHRYGGLLPGGALSNLQNVVTYARNKPILVALQRRVREDVRNANSMRYWREHPDLTQGIRVNWDYMKSATVGHKYLHQRVQFMKVLITEAFAYSHRRMEWRLLAPSRNTCDG